MADPIRVQDILNDCRQVYLNDTAGARFTDDKMIPHLRVANGMLETALEKNDVQCKNQIALPFVVAAGAVEYFPLPSDFIWPVKMEERLSGSDDLYSPMVQRVWEPQTTVTNKLIYWVHRNDKIYFKGANADIEVLLYYQRAFYPINAVEDSVYSNAREYLSAMTAALIHEFVSQNETLAGRCKDIGEGHLEEIINIMTKKRQSTPIRRKGYVPFR